MYVKVTQGADMGGDFLLLVRSDSIISGTAVLPWDSEKQDGKLLGDNDPAGELWKQLEMEGTWWRLVHVLEIDTEQFVVAEASGQGDEVEFGPEKLILKYAWWWHEDGGAEAVVTTRNIFIVGEDGKTIDRVR
jgi:hypothetical protein